MNRSEGLHLLIVGWEASVVTDLWHPVASNGDIQYSFILHPRHTLDDFPKQWHDDQMHFFRLRKSDPLLPQDLSFLNWLENDGVPTVHNMILGDRVVSTLPYPDALSYATFLGKRLKELFERIRPDAMIGSFDALHGSIALAVAKRLNIPWFAMNFSVIPPGFACFCNQMSPAARVTMRARSVEDGRLLAESSLSDFELRRVSAPAYLEPPRLSIGGQIARIPDRIAALVRTLRNGRDRHFHRYTESLGHYNVPGALKFLRKVASARSAVERLEMMDLPPAQPYVFFGLHTQPESSIDVWAPYYSNQMWVIETIARSIPPSHRLLVKIHKSDTGSYSASQLEKIRLLPGVDLVKPFADTRRFIERAALVFAIQGTIGLEAALLGVPVVLLGDSPVALFPSASRIGTIEDLPSVVQRKLAETKPHRTAILEAYATYLSPFEPAAHNDWTIKKSGAEFQKIAEMMDLLARYVARGQVPLTDEELPDHRPQAPLQ
ncbi:MAG: hypothetical protein ABI771_14965 [Betaproteobacteria bacterium]